MESGIANPFQRYWEVEGLQVEAPLEGISANASDAVMHLDGLQRLYRLEGIVANLCYFLRNNYVGHLFAIQVQILRKIRRVTAVVHKLYPHPGRQVADVHPFDAVAVCECLFSYFLY